MMHEGIVFSVVGILQLNFALLQKVRSKSKILSLHIWRFPLIYDYLQIIAGITTYMVRIREIKCYLDCWNNWFEFWLAFQVIFMQFMPHFPHAHSHSHMTHKLDHNWNSKWCNQNHIEWKTFDCLFWINIPLFTLIHNHFVVFSY